MFHTVYFMFFFRKFIACQKQISIWSFNRKEGKLFLGFLWWKQGGNPKKSTNTDHRSEMGERINLFHRGKFGVKTQKTKFSVLCWILSKKTVTKLFFWVGGNKTKQKKLVDTSNEFWWKFVENNERHMGEGNRRKKMICWMTEMSENRIFYKEIKDTIWAMVSH